MQLARSVQPSVIVLASALLCMVVMSGRHAGPLKNDKATIDRTTAPGIVTAQERAKLALVLEASSTSKQDDYQTVGPRQSETMTPAERRKHADAAAHTMKPSSTKMIFTPNDKNVPNRPPGLEGLTPAERAKLELLRD